jgi:cytochrome c
MKTFLPLSALCLLPLLSTPASAADAAKGATLYAQRCAMCHGEKGAGDGALAATLPEGQKPRNLSGGNNKYATDDAKLKEIIKKGGAAVGLSVLMPAQADLNDEQIGDLVAFVNSLKK